MIWNMLHVFAKKKKKKKEYASSFSCLLCHNLLLNADHWSSFYMPEKKTESTCDLILSYTLYDVS